MQYNFYLLSGMIYRQATGSLYWFGDGIDRHKTTCCIGAAGNKISSRKVKLDKQKQLYACNLYYWSKCKPLWIDGKMQAFMKPFCNHEAVGRLTHTSRRHRATSASDFNPFAAFTARHLSNANPMLTRALSLDWWVSFWEQRLCLLDLVEGFIFSWVGLLKAPQPWLWSWAPAIFY